MLSGSPHTRMLTTVYAIHSAEQGAHSKLFILQQTFVVCLPPFDSIKMNEKCKLMSLSAILMKTTMKGTL